MMNALASHYHLQCFMIEDDIYLKKGECACVTLPPAVFHCWARYLFTEWWMYLRHTTTWRFSLMSTTFIYRMVNVFPSHYRLQVFIIEHDIYLKNGECACVTLPPAVFHCWARYLFTEWWMYLRHTTTWRFSLMSTTFIYRMVNVLASHYHLQLFIVEHDIYLQNGECACVTLPPAVFHYWEQHLFFCSLLFQNKWKHYLVVESQIYNVNQVNVCKWFVAVIEHIRWLAILLSCY